jgi:hypothetical protein
MTDVTAVRRAVDPLLAGEPGPLLDLLADQVELEVTAGGETHPCRQGSGRDVVADYFRALGGIVAFWQLDYTAEGRQVIAWGHERFTLAGCGVEGGCEFALVFELADGLVTRLLVIEDLRAFMRGGRSVGHSTLRRRGRRLRGPATLSDPRPTEPAAWVAEVGDRTPVEA